VLRRLRLHICHRLRLAVQVSASLGLGRHLTSRCRRARRDELRSGPRPLRRLLTRRVVHGPGLGRLHDIHRSTLGLGIRLRLGLHRVADLTHVQLTGLVEVGLEPVRRRGRRLTGGFELLGQSQLHRRRRDLGRRLGVVGVPAAAGTGRAALLRLSTFTAALLGGLLASRTGRGAPVT